MSIVITAAIIGGMAFYGGMEYGGSRGTTGSSQTSLPAGGQNFQLSGSQRLGNRLAGGFAAGEIISRDDKSITIKTRDGGSKIIFYSGTTEIGKFINGSPNDFEIGKNISVSGATNSDGSITAQSIQLRLLDQTMPIQ